MAFSDEGSEAPSIGDQVAQYPSAVAVDSDPPFLTTYKALFDSQPIDSDGAVAAEECELPLIDLRRLERELEAEQCKRDIAAAASDWGFFQVVNHGVSGDLLERVREVQVNLFQQPFKKKAEQQLLGFSPDSYRWGTPTATTLRQLSWSEAYHIPLAPPASETIQADTRYVIEIFSVAMLQLAHQLTGTLAERLGSDGTYIRENCTCNTCYLRLNHYPPCPLHSEVFGLVPHTDSDFLTIVCQDQVGGLQLMKGGRWITIKPNPEALIVNIGDLFQAWSNGVYKSVEHRVVPNPRLERFSVAYFLCPSKDTVIESHVEPAIYKKFSFGEYRQQVQEDVKLTGHKVGLQRFLLKRMQ